jgi:hypothetical protein
MEKNLLLALSCSVSLLLIGCEQSSNVSEFPYEPKVVVNCVIQAGRPIDKIMVARTLPIPVNYSDAEAEVRNASVAIATKDTVIVYKYTEPFTYTTSGLVAKTGQTYTLLVQWEDKFATATTTVPRIGVAASPAMKISKESAKVEKYLETKVEQRAGEVYGCTWIAYFANGAVADEAATYAGITGKTSGATVFSRSSTIPENLLGMNLKYGVRLHSYDPQYYDYYYSQTDNQVSGNIYLRANTNIKWNVHGDGIGMFIAKADTIVKIN